jgi:hypothetical protein
MMARQVEAVRDRIFAMCGSAEAVIPLTDYEAAALGATRVTMQWRKPLSLTEVAQLAPTPEVRARPGRP